MRNVETNIGGIITGLGTVLLGGMLGLLTARATARSQLSGTALTIDEQKQKRLDDQVGFVMDTLRKEIARLEQKIATLEAENKAQATRIDQQEATIIRMRRTLEEHDLEIPKP